MGTKHYREFIFDIDGTLIDTEKAVMESLKQVLREMGKEEKKDEDLKFVFGIPGDVSLKRLGIEDVEKANGMWNRYMIERKGMIKEFEGIKSVLTRLKGKGCKLGIVTSKTRKEYESEFVPLGMAGYFETVICVEDAARPKPSGEPIREYLKRSGTDSEEVIYIGDTAYDSQCAEEAGVNFGWAEWGKADGKGIKAAARLKRPEDILTIAADNSRQG